MSGFWMLLLLVMGCGGEGGSDEAATDDTNDDTDLTDTDTGDTGEPDIETTGCADLGLPEVAFQAGGGTAALNGLAGDFTVPTREGDWTFSENFSGCDTYLFIPDVPRQEGADLWGKKRDVKKLMQELPLNTHLFFIPTVGGENNGAQLNKISGHIDSVLADLGTADHWADRIHYVTKKSSNIDGWLGESLNLPGWGVGIDRFQKIRYIGSFADPDRYNNSSGWFDGNLSMAASESIYYNFEAERHAELETDGATVIRAFDGEVISDGGWTGQRGSIEVELPDAATMATFDTLVFDLDMGCVGDGEYGDCPPWDYLVYLYLCDEDDPNSCGTEVGRWITTYHREGRYVHDVSPLLPLFKNGGTRRLEFYTVQAYEVTLDLRLSNQGTGLRPVSAQRVWRGGGLSHTYNDRPLEYLDIPSTAQKVELATIISGHGMENPGNCAEFCNISHHFTFDGSEVMIDYPIAGDTWGCKDDVANGTVPNQYGTWWYGRNGWCPGKQVPVERRDITSLVTPGTSVEMSYEALFQGADYTNGAARMEVDAWVVVYE